MECNVSKSSCILCHLSLKDANNYCDSLSYEKEQQEYDFIYICQIQLLSIFTGFCVGEIRYIHSYPIEFLAQIGQLYPACSKQGACVSA